MLTKDSLSQLLPRHFSLAPDTRIFTTSSVGQTHKRMATVYTIYFIEQKLIEHLPCDKPYSKHCEYSAENNRIMGLYTHRNDILTVKTDNNQVNKETCKRLSTNGKYHEKIRQWGVFRCSGEVISKEMEVTGDFNQMKILQMRILGNKKSKYKYLEAEASLVCERNI